MVMSTDQNAGRIQRVRIDSSTFERAEEFKYLGTALTNQNSIAEEINPSAWGHLNPSSCCDVGRLFYGVFKLWYKLQRKK